MSMHSYLSNNKNTTKYLSANENWGRYCFVLISFFILKAVSYMCIIPPFEGWDEYQHLAYIYHLETHDERPVLTKTTVSRSLLEEIVSFPVSSSMYEQTYQTGSLSYRDYFNTQPKYNRNHTDIILYQAQHGSLYYRLMQQLLKTLPSDISIQTKVAILRGINILLTGITFLSILWLIPRIVPNYLHAFWLALLILSQPLLTINGIRITNDPLAIATGVWVVIIGLISSLRSRYHYAIIAGILMGLSCWAKSTSFVLLPFWFCCMITSFLRKEISFSKMVLLSFLPLILAIMILSEYFSFNLKHYGILFIMQEAIINKNNATGFFDILRAISISDIFKDIYFLWIKEPIWVGGWSFLTVHHIRNIALVVTTLALLSWPYKLVVNRKTEKGVVQLQAALLCLILCLGTSASISWHYIQCVMAYGPDGPTSCSWYLCAALPFFLVFVYDSGCRWSEKTGTILASILIGIYLYADIRGGITMLHHYSGEATGLEALSRIASMQTPVLGTATLICCVLLLTVLIFTLFIEMKRQFHNQFG